MTKFKILLTFLLCLGLSTQVIALERDYFAIEYCKDHQKTSERYYLIERYLSIIPATPKCMHIDCTQCHQVWLNERYDDDDYVEYLWTCECEWKSKSSNFLGAWLPSWIGCSNPCIYDGYVSEEHNKYFSLFYEYLNYVEQSKCECFWPEISKKAAAINDKAYLLFEELFQSELEQLVYNYNDQKEFFNYPYANFNLHGVTLSCVCHCFFYSDYDWVCRDLDFYSKTHFEKEQALIISDKLNDIRACLAEMFLDLYTECEKKHPHERIKRELFSVRSFLNLPLFDNPLLEEGVSKNRPKSLKAFQSLSSDFLFATVIPSRPANWELSDIYLMQGTCFNDLNLYKQSIDFLTQSIEHNALNRDAYIERAMAYFETDQMELALKDYESAKKLAIIPPFKLSSYDSLIQSGIIRGLLDNKIEFSQGLVLGTLEGSAVSLIDFIPSNLSCCRGILNGLWAFTCSPKEVSLDVIHTAYALGEFISDHTPLECLHCVVPELKELSETWDSLNDHTRGRKIGFIIGKYGIEIVAPTVILKGISKFRALKRANTMFTLENCAVSTSKKSKILEESTKRAVIRNTMMESAKQGKILVKNSNVQYHVMQKKHAWDKVITLSGNVEEDFKKVIILLEKECITEKQFLCEKPMHFPKENPKIIRTDHKKFINDQEVYAVFEKYIENGEVYLKDAWVITE